MGKAVFKSVLKRRVGVGFFIAVVAALIIFQSASYRPAYSGCAGDCMTCHPKLKGDKNHRTLETCINCHAPSSAKVSVFGSDNDGCGDRCFQCHNRWPLDGYHAALNTCLKCHEK